MSNEVQFPYIYVPDPTKGRPIFLGDIYIGIQGLDPKVALNQVQLSVRQEDGTEVTVTQPISTSAGGVPLYQGSPVTLLIDESVFSIRIDNSSGSQVYYQASAVAGDSTSLPFPIQNYYTDSGSTNAYLLTNSTETPTASSYFDGMTAEFISDNDNTGASTVNINSIGIKNIKQESGDDLVAGQIAGRSVIVYDLANDWFEFSVANRVVADHGGFDNLHFDDLFGEVDAKLEAVVACASGLVDGVGTHVGGFNLATSKTGTGVYLVTPSSLALGSENNQLAPAVTPLGTSSISCSSAWIVFGGVPLCELRFFNSAGTLQDVSFHATFFRYIDI